MSARRTQHHTNRPPPIDLSIIIPARNEQRVIGNTLHSLRQTLRETGLDAEIIVVNDDSGDSTPTIAASLGARVLDVQLHNIAAVRNAGAAIASAQTLIFLDADTLLPPQTLRAALRALDSGCLGGGAAVRFDSLPGWAHRLLAQLFILYWQRMRGWAAGCFIFVRRDAFESVGGFDAAYFAAEEKVLSQALKRSGRFVVLREPVITSARKVRLFSLWRLVGIAASVLLGGEGRLKRREGLEILYDAPREEGPEEGSRIPLDEGSL